MAIRVDNSEFTVRGESSSGFNPRAKLVGGHVEGHFPKLDGEERRARERHIADRNRKQDDRREATDEIRDTRDDWWETRARDKDHDAPRQPSMDERVRRGSFHQF